jgi:hypothetical protein
VGLSFCPVVACSSQRPLKASKDEYVDAESREPSLAVFGRKQAIVRAEDEPSVAKPGG